MYIILKDLIKKLNKIFNQISGREEKRREREEKKKKKKKTFLTFEQ
jgi:hypothetical protein